MFISAAQIRAFTLTMLCASPMCFADSQIDALTIAGDIVHIELANAAQSRLPAACVKSEYQRHWTLSLNTASGKASYALLVNAFEQQKLVTITGAGDCQDSPGIERIHSIRVQQKHGDDSVLYLYKGDGVTKLGRILKWEEGQKWPDLAVMILPNELSQFVKTVYPRRAMYPLENLTYYFTRRDCTGFKAIHAAENTIYFNEHINNGQFFTIQLYREHQTQSMLNVSTGECTNFNSYRQTAYEFEVKPVAGAVGICGYAPCKIKP